MKPQSLEYELSANTEASCRSGRAAAADSCPICGGRPIGWHTVIRANEVAVCGVCASWYRVPLPSFEDLLRIYDKDYYSSWGMDEDESIARATKHASFARAMRQVERHLGKGRSEKARILDVGAATGMLLQVAVARGWDPYAVELNPRAAEVLRRRYGVERVFEGELTARPFSSRFFHAITMMDVIEHVLDVGATLRAAANLLVPGGVLCLSTPRIDSLSRLFMGRNWLHFKWEHIQYSSRAGITRALHEGGFQDVRVRGYTKHLTVDYLCHQLRTYPHWALTPAIRAVRRLLPRGMRRRPVGCRRGEMLVTARSAAGDLGAAPGGGPADG